MAKNSITDYDNIANNNLDINSINIAEQCPPGNINNAIRELMADLADVNDGTVSMTSPSLASATITTATISGGSITGITDLAVADGGTGASTAEGARANLNVDPAGTAVALAIALG